MSVVGTTEQSKHLRTRLLAIGAVVLVSLAVITFVIVRPTTDVAAVDALIDNWISGATLGTPSTTSASPATVDRCLTTNDIDVCLQASREHLASAQGHIRAEADNGEKRADGLASFAALVRSASPAGVPEVVMTELASAADDLARIERNRAACNRARASSIESEVEAKCAASLLGPPGSKVRFERALMALIPYGSRPVATVETLSHWPLTLDVRSAGSTPSNNQAVVPTVVFMTVEQATRELTKAGFKVERRDVPNDSTTPGQVFEQNPKGQSTADDGSTVTISVTASSPGKAPPSSSAH